MKIFGKSFTLPTIFQQKKSRGPTPKGPDGFTDPMLDHGWVQQTANITDLVEVTRYQACYFAAWMFIDTDEFRKNRSQHPFGDAGEQLDPSSGQGAGVMQLSDFTITVLIDSDAELQLKKYYGVMSITREAGEPTLRNGGRAEPVWKSMLSACKGDASKAEHIARRLNNGVVPAVVSEYIRFLQGIDSSKATAGSVLIPTGNSFQLTTVVGP